MWPFKRLSTTRANTPSSTRSSRPNGGYALTRCARSPFPLLNHLRVTVIASLVWGSGGGHIAFTPIRVAKIFEKSTSGVAGELRQGRADGSVAGWTLSAKLSPNSKWLACPSDETKLLQVYVQTFPHRDASGRYRPTAATVPCGAAMEGNCSTSGRTSR